MCRSLQANQRVAALKQQRPPPIPLENTISDEEPVAIDDFWRVQKSGDIMRRCTLRGTALLLRAILLDAKDQVLPTTHFSSCESILLTASRVLDGDNVFDGDSQSNPTAKIKLSREKLTRDVYNEAVASVTDEDAHHAQLLAVLTNAVPFLDLFCAEKKGIMILKFNGPEKK